jgi:predicted PurR-regulated permease PerM
MRQYGNQTPEDAGHAPAMKRVLATVAVVAAALLLLLLVWYGVSVVLLVFASVLLAIFFSKVSQFVSAHTGLAYGWSLTLVTVGLLALVGGGLWFTGSALGQQVDNLLERVPHALQQLQQRLEQHAWARRLLAEFPQAGAKIAEKTDVAAKAPAVVSNVFGALAYGVVFVALGLYLAIDPGVYVRGLVRLVPRPKRARVQEVLQEVGMTLGHWLVGRIVSMGIVGGITAVGLGLLGVPLAPALGLLAALAEFVPNVGPFLAFVPALLLALTESATRALAVLLLYLGVQGFESYVLTPLVEKRAVALPPALTITAQVLMAVLAGGLGLALATPLAAAALVLVQRLYVEDTLGDALEVPLSPRLAAGGQPQAQPGQEPSG